MSYGRRLVRRALGTGGRSDPSGTLGAALSASAEAYAQWVRWRRAAERRAEAPLRTSDRVSGGRFAGQVALALERLGWSIVGSEEHPSADASFIGEDAWGTRCFVQCPLGQRGVADVAVVYAALASRDAWHCDRSMVVVPDGVRFTHAARDYARGADVSLMRLLSSGELAHPAV